MRIRATETEPYERQVLPSEEIPIVRSLSEERSREIPQVPANPIWNALGKASDVVYEVATQMQEVERLEDYQQRQMDMSRRLTEARLSIINDPKYLQYNANELTSNWRKKSDDIRAEIIEPVQNKRSKADLTKSWTAVDNDNMVYFTGHGWQNTVARQSDQRKQASVQATMDYVNGADPKNMEPFTRMIKLFDDAISARLMTKEEAAFELQAWQNNTTREFFQRQFVTQIQNSPNYEINKKELEQVISDNEILNANDKTILLHQLDQFYDHAKVKSKDNADVEQEKTAYATVYSRFRNDNIGAAKWIRDPSNMPDLKPAIRNRLASTFEHLDALNEKAVNDEREKVVDKFLQKVYSPDRTGTLTSEDVYNSILTPGQKEHFLKILAQPPNKKDITTDYGLYESTLRKAYRGEINTVDDILGLEGVGVKDKEHLIQVARSSENTEKRAMNNAIEYGKRIIKSTTLIEGIPPKAPSKSATEEDKARYAKELHEWQLNNSIDGRVTRFSQDLEKAVTDGVKEGKKVVDMLDLSKPDNVVDPILKNHIKTMDEQLSAVKSLKPGSKGNQSLPVKPKATEKKINTDLLKSSGYSEEDISWATKALTSRGAPVTDKNIIEVLRQRQLKIQKETGITGY